MTKTTTKPETIGIPELSASLAEAHDLTKARAKAMLDVRRMRVGGLHTMPAGLRDNLPETVAKLHTLDSLDLSLLEYLDCGRAVRFAGVWHKAFGTSVVDKN